MLIINNILILLALSFGGEDKQYPSPLIEEWFDTITFIKIQKYMNYTNSEGYTSSVVDYDERVYFWRKRKPIAVVYNPLKHNISICCDKISPYLYWHDEVADIWIKPSNDHKGRWLETGIYRKARSNDIRFEYDSTKLTKLEDLLGIKEIRFEWPQVPFGSDFKILEVEEKDLWERK